PRPGGAFALATENENPLPFAGVAAQGRGECWQVNGQAAPALTAWQLDVGESLGAPAYTRSMAQRCASEMVRLLSLGQQGQAGFAGPDGHWQKVRPADMAVLVRNFREAQAIRAELSARGVKSVYLSDKDSVLESPEAADLLRWLRACAAPDDDRLLRAALASPTLAQPWALLDQLNQDEREWEERVQQFRGYRNLWLRQGVLPMLQLLLHDFDVPAQLLASDDGERRLTNLLHLAELLQQASRELDGEQALIRHLDDQVQGRAGGGGDDQVLRLESDAELVKVVTIHKSKGLEYPLVFLPFISNARLEEGKGKPLRVRENGTQRLVMSATAPDLVLADHERMAEDMRLLYVAVTRARHACWLGLTDLVRGAGKHPVLHLSAIGRLLSGGEEVKSAADLARHLVPWEAFEGVAVTDAPGVAHVRFRPEESGLPDLQARTPVRAAAEHWWIASYSALRMDSQAASRQDGQLRTDDAGPESAAAAKASDDERHAVFLPLRPGETPTIHRFPRGPGPGTFLHGLLELAAREGFGTLADPATCAEWLRPRCLRRGLGEWVETLGLWLSELLVREWPLPGTPGLSLAGLSPTAFQPELEFLFAASHVQVAEIDALIQQHILPGRPRPPALDDQLNGLLKGYIDLVLEHEGRYYVVDYKSNWLGNDAAAYHPQAMEEAMLEHRYDLQFTLYLLALHRQLKARLPGYDYDRHIGGAVYWFVRGSADSGAGIWQQRPPRALIETLDRQFAGEVPLSVSLPTSNPTREPV
ncbi:MAG TPA: 3'-5' exonuclease, partial [Kineobactrum sp.]